LAAVPHGRPFERSRVCLDERLFGVVPAEGGSTENPKPLVWRVNIETFDEFIDEALPPGVFDTATDDYQRITKARITGLSVSKDPAQNAAIRAT